MYEIIFEKRALHDLNKLDKKIKQRIWNKLQDCKEDPFRFFIKLIETAGYKLRVGDWRIIGDILIEKQVVIILKVGHRRNIYDN